MISHVLPFGRHKGIPLPDVPLSYLQWLLREVKLSSGLRAAVADEVSRRGGTPPPAPPPPAPPRCPDCRSASESVYRWQQRRDGQRVIRAECGACAKFITFTPLVEPYTAAADAAASMTPDLDLLISCCELGIGLKSDGEAADFATPADWHRAPQRVKDLLRQCTHSLARKMGRQTP
jgi:hypothetical protein